MINSLKGKRILVTGATGFVGTWLGAWLHQAGAEVFGLSRVSGGKQMMFDIVRSKEFVQLLQADVTDHAAVFTAIRQVKPEFIFHIAALSSSRNANDDPFLTMKSNVMGTVHILESVKEMDSPCHIVFINSDRCYRVQSPGHIYNESDLLGGDDPYSASKAAAEIAVSSYTRSYFSAPDSGVRIGTVRPNNVIGGGDWTEGRIIPDCVRNWQRSLPVHLERPLDERPWQHVLDMLYGVLLVASELADGPRYNGQSYNLGPSKDHFIPMKDLVTRFGHYWPTLDQNKLYTTPDQTLAPSQAGVMAVNCEKARLELGWQIALPLEIALEWTAEWYQKQLSGEHDMLEVTIGQIKRYEQLVRQA